MTALFSFKSLGLEHNFDKINTLNQDTPYDYGSVMHYHQ